ncbi:unnamed protein product [Zymoseptoria tritici ST99CH_1A5]|uniref:Ino eighty subunit 1 n=2 Tax=Zymoseptoria tritici TaxID=1047171 RepID=A0A2H1GP31_ZYMTR|nr:unnamed protein product [Zymoseptoria tritici ST99CH_1E4]SMY26050.1 unnamed protein product [Zymoseptoria tritici ST99CH_1A5]
MSALSHILAPDLDVEMDSRRPDQPPSFPPPPPPAAADATPMATVAPTTLPPPEHLEDDDGASANNTVGTPRAEHGGDEPMYTSTTTSLRRNANGATSSVYSGNKIRHLKKEDGIPLWRKDIQYDFLKLVFFDQTKCFTKFSDGTNGHTFADIYIDAMAKSSKCSKILKEKLLQDQDGAISMAMVCLLVNVGRMNTTLNFFPEMRAQLRTYHSIPALQAHQDPNAYKQLQDAPRLKSILKGATEDEPQPATMDEIKAASRPRTNPVNLIFVMSQYAPKISELHFPPPRDFFDLVMRSSLGSVSRAKAFLWLIWWYLESDFTKEDAERNPFGPGQFDPADEGADALPVKVPTLESLTEEQAAEENVDTEEEKHFGEVKRKERIAILASEPSPAMTALKRARKEKGLTTGHGVHASDDEGSEVGSYHRGMMPASVGKMSTLHLETASDYTRSPSPAGSRGFQPINNKPVSDMRIDNMLNSDDVAPDPSSPQAVPEFPAPSVKKGPGRGNWRRNKTKDAASSSRTAQEGHHIPLLPATGQIDFINDAPSSSAFHYNSNKMPVSPTQSQTISGFARDHIPTPSYQAQKRHRGVTQHQSAVMTHRKQQIDYTLDRRIRKAHVAFRNTRESESAIVRAWKRIRALPLDYDSEEEGIRVRKARERADKTDDEWRSGVHRGGKENDDFLDNVDLWRRPRVLLAGFVKIPGEPTDVGEEVRSLAQSFRKASRRLQRWGETGLPGQAVITRRATLDRGGSRRDRNESFDLEDDERMPAPPVAVKAGSKRRRSAKAQPGPRKARRSVKRESVAQEPQPELEEVYEHDGAGGVGGINGGQGAAELDDDDREMLGEVDADESEEDGDGDEMDVDD